LASGQLDLAVLNLPLPSRDLVATQLFTEDLVLVVPVDHPLTARPLPLPLTILGELPLLVPLPGTAFRDELDAAILPAGIVLSPTAEIDGLRLIASLTFEGYGPAVLPATAIPASMRERFRALAVEGLPPRRVGVAQRSRGLPSAPTRALIELLQSVVREAGDLPHGLHPATDGR
ncbi:MAG: LysR family transcriptional regulator substrate-binding protein, partial [Actinomycetota bacterium]|nr:LysR family transcriptional regulator substrate-binding protein [Actinomycetota bacterium]